MSSWCHTLLSSGIPLPLWKIGLSFEKYNKETGSPVEDVTGFMKHALVQNECNHQITAAVHDM